MATSGKKIVIASSGSSFGHYTHVAIMAPLPAAQWQEVTSSGSRSFALPDVSAAARLMATSAKTLGLGVSGTFFGHETRLKKYAIATATVSGPPQRMQAYFLGV